MRMFDKISRRGARIERILCFLVLYSAGLLFPAEARGQGGPPLLTDDPGTPGNRNWEINIAFTGEHRHDARLFEAPLLDINYGWGDRIQLKFEVPWLFLHERDARAQSGMGNSAVGVKWRFLDEGKHAVSLSTYPQFEFNSRGSSVEHGLVEPGRSLLLPLEIQRKVGPIELNGEGGYEIVEKGRDEWILGLAFGREISRRMELLGEVYGSGLVSEDEHDLVFDLGSRWSLNKNFVLLFMAGRSFSGPVSGQPQFFAYVGIQFYGGNLAGD